MRKEANIHNLLTVSLAPFGSSLTVHVSELRTKADAASKIQNLQ